LAKNRGDSAEELNSKAIGMRLANDSQTDLCSVYLNRYIYIAQIAATINKCYIFSLSWPANLVYSV